VLDDSFEFEEVAEPETNRLILPLFLLFIIDQVQK
jgi:hypothetical protein